MTTTHSESGFSLAELLVATGVLLVVSSIVTSALLQMTQSQSTIWNRTEMHSGIRGATELLQQEVGQAGRVSVPGTTAFPGVIILNTAVNPVGGANPHAVLVCDAGNPTTSAATVQVSSTAGIFVSTAPPAYMLLTTMDGDAKESIKVATAAGTTMTACFTSPHAAGTVMMPLGSFATGVIPPTGMLNGSSATVLKLYGDINGDGNMVYVEYTCDSTVRHNLYRNVMAFNAGSKPAVDASQILLGNVIPNPGLPPIDCFTYQTATMLVQGTPFTFVLDVAVTLTIETELVDSVTRQKQTETKALLNVSPRNVFSAWMLAGMSYTDRIQSTPATVTALLP